MNMRASVPAVFLAFAFASPAFAGNGAQREAGSAAAAGEPPALSPGGAADGDCAGCGPKLPYAIDLVGDAAPAAVVAATGPASTQPVAGWIDTGGRGVQLLDALSSDAPPELKLAGLVTLAAPAQPNAPAPLTAPARAPAPAPAPDLVRPICP